MGLQELVFDGEFDGAMTIDAMGNIGPEDWPVVLANLHRAVRRGGHLYLTVEEIDITEIDRAFSESTARRLPAIHGEVIEGDTAGYHYYPGRDQVMSWLGAEELDVVDDDSTRRTIGATATCSFERVTHGRLPTLLARARPRADPSWTARGTDRARFVRP